MKNYLIKRFYLIAICLLLSSTGFAVSLKTIAQSETFQETAFAQVSPNIVISQFQTGGGTADDEFIELHNTGSSNFDLNGFRLVYRSANGTNDVTFAAWTTSTIIAPGGYYLIASNGYDGSIVPNLTYFSSTCSCALGGAGGGLAIRSGAVNTGIIFDSVGYGTATNAFIEGTKTAAPPPVNNGQARVNNGCQDTDNNANDFSTLNPSAPRNASSAPNTCGGSGGTNLLAGGGANPSTVSPGATTLLTVSVFPATTPPSTGITVVGNLTNIGGSAAQQFFDDGNNGDVTPNDNTFSYLATIPAGTAGGTKNITATAADAESRTANVSFNITINAPVAGEDHLLLGNPSNATADVANENNYLMTKPQYSLSYNRSKATPNWVSWRLDSTWIGSAQRQDDFRPDPALPADWYHVSDNSYSGSGFDRGHHTPSGDRTRSIPDNSATFLMTNMMPQAGGNNQGPWNDLENYTRSLLTQGNEAYIIAGGTGVGGIGASGTVVNTIDNGRVTVPAQTWKVILILPNGDNDVSRVNNNTRTIAVIMPNIESVRNDSWEKYLATVDQVEALTGYDFFSNVAPATQAVIESKLDAQNNTAPTASPRSINTAEDTAQNVTLAATDPNVNSQISYIIVANPAHGSLSGSGATLTYTPEANYFGSDSFTYKASDGTAESAPVTVSINVTQVNDAPIASADSKTTAINTALSFPAADLTANDSAGAVNENTQTLTVTQLITTAQTHGQVSLNGGQITYQPDANYSGVASFDYQVCDNGTTNGQSDIKCAISTVSVNVGTVINYEADVSPRESGDGRVSSTDVSVIQGFQIGIGLPYQSNEFQRADCAPFSTRGDGRVSSIDVAQAQAYQLGFNLTAQSTLQPAAGPTAPINNAQSALKFENWIPSEKTNESTAHSGLQALREVRVVNSSLSSGQTIVVPIEVDAFGDESVYGFSLSYDATRLSNPIVSIGDAGGIVLSNTNKAGNIGVSVNFGGGTITAGNNLRLINVQFTVADNTVAGTTPLKFTDTLATIEVASSPSNPAGVLALPTIFTDGILNLPTEKSRKRARFF